MKSKIQKSKIYDQKKSRMKDKKNPKILKLRLKNKKSKIHKFKIQNKEIQDLRF